MARYLVRRERYLIIWGWGFNLETMSDSAITAGFLIPIPWKGFMQPYRETQIHHKWNTEKTLYEDSIADMPYE